MTEDPVSGSHVQENALLISGVRGQTERAGWRPIERQQRLK